MELEQALGYTEADFQKFVDQLVQENPVSNTELLRKQWDPYGHDVMDSNIRKDKYVMGPTEANAVTGNTTQEIKSVIPVARLPLPLQQQITNRSSSFLTGNPIERRSSPVTEEESNFVDAVSRIWNENKMDYKTTDIATRQMSETKAAEIWFVERVEPGYWDKTGLSGSPFRMRSMIVSPFDNNRLYPSFSETGDMTAFGREYIVTMGELSTRYFEIYTKDNTFKGRMASNEDTWTVKREPQVLDSIPVIYYTQPKAEWADVQPLISRLEFAISRHADTNDYFGSPIFLLKGVVTGMPGKEDSGKALQAQGDGTAEFLTWDNIPESLKMEIENLLKFIYDLTDTPNISLDQMKDVGTFSGIAIKLLFMAAHLKASSKAGQFGECLQRRINLLKKAVIKFKPGYSTLARFEITPVFKYYLPENVKEQIEILTEAAGVGIPILSQKRAVELSPLTTDPVKEVEQIEKETAERAESIDPIDPVE